MVEWFEFVAAVVSFVIGLVSAKVYYRKFKKKLHEIRECIDAIDNALEDDKITKEEVKQIVNKCKEIIGR